MSEENEKIPHELVKRQESHHLTKGGEPHGNNNLEKIDHRISDSDTSIRDAMMLTQIRRELIQQDEHRLDRYHMRTTEKRQFWSKLVFSGSAVLTGIGFVGLGHPIEGFAVMGIGFHWLAPDFVKSIYDRILSRGANQNGK